ncbi:MAG TPA: hypothetical protein VIX90_15660 [Edaphobacter sp.]
MLPYAGNATPATYMVDGKQYVVIAASGARDGKDRRVRPMSPSLYRNLASKKFLNE